MRRWIAIVLMVELVPMPCTATIVNTLRGFETEEAGWSGNVEGSFNVKGGNSEVAALGAGARMQWQGERHRVRLLGAANRTSGGTEKIEESVMVHLRHNRVLVSKVSSLVFLQWQRNPFQRLTSRYLLGVGARFGLAQSEFTQVAVGVTHMVEVERIQDQSTDETSQRLSAFLALDHRLSDDVRLNATAFGQPDWAHWSDVRATAQAALRVKLGGRLDLLVGGQWQYDARPPQDVQDSDWGVETGLSYEL